MKKITMSKIRDLQTLVTHASANLVLQTMKEYRISEKEAHEKCKTEYYAKYSISMPPMYYSCPPK